MLGEFPYGQIKDLVRGPDGFIYRITPSDVFRVHPGTSNLEPVAKPGGSYYEAMTFDRDGRLYWGRGPTSCAWTSGRVPIGAGILASPTTSLVRRSPRR